MNPTVHPKEDALELVRGHGEARCNKKSTTRTADSIRGLAKPGICLPSFLSARYCHPILDIPYSNNLILPCLIPSITLC